ncbi:HesA/MoeB/ThiF family protein [Methanofollis fontis]|uniref:Adenylyltransferase n=1 Tax=Methanofollis fontis TaxID=2052832 RepID=A0A483CN88_9EURY|nr:HesA/MoeB/ThiF family protein [Methanofollis fontis]TAJ44532.1 adenylyltransferase [Methanofollis fontis]
MLSSDRYIRQKETVGEGGQELLQAATVLIAGAGGLGSPAALYCAAAGVGRIRIVDHDAVEESNLNRQILHTGDAIGRPKVVSAAARIGALNDDVEIEPLRLRIDPESVGTVVRGADLIIDAMDSYESRYILNTAALAAGIPLIHGAVKGYYGQVTVIRPGVTPCLRCILPVPPAPEKTDVIGPTCGIVGSIQAMEAIKLITGEGKPLEGRVLLIDGKNGRADEMPVEREAECPDCGGIMRPPMEEL